MITPSIPVALDLSMMVLSAGMSTSQPSRPKRFSDDHFLARKSSNLDMKKCLDVSSWMEQEAVDDTVHWNDTIMV